MEAMSHHQQSSGPKYHHSAMFQLQQAHLRILYCDLYMTRSQCEEFKAGVICSRLLVRVVSRIVECCTPVGVLCRSPIGVLWRHLAMSCLIRLLLRIWWKPVLNIRFSRLFFVRHVSEQNVLHGTVFSTTWSWILSLTFTRRSGLVIVNIYAHRGIGMKHANL